MGAICVKNYARTASEKSSGSAPFRSGSNLNTIQTKMDKTYYQRLQIIKESLISSTVNSPEKFPKNYRQLREISDFKFIRHLGDGSYGYVVMVKDLKSGHHYAMKIIRKYLIIEREYILNALSERYILAAMDHPFVVKLHYAFQTKNKIYLIVDLMSGGELFYLLRRNKKFPYETARFYAAEILLALEYLHIKKIIYRDLKPENVLLDKDGHVKLTDFGLSKVMLKKNEVATSVCGTPEYIAPEVLKGKGYTVAADWFSFVSLFVKYKGSLLYDMLTGKPPFYSKDKEEMMYKIQTKEIPFPEFLSPAAKSLLKSLFYKKYSNRLGFKLDAEYIKKHEFFKPVNFDDIYNKRIKAPFSFYYNINSQGFAVKYDEFEVEESYEKDLVYKSKGVNFEGFTYQVKAAKYPESKGTGNDFSLQKQYTYKFDLNQYQYIYDVDLYMKITDTNNKYQSPTLDANFNKNEFLNSSTNNANHKYNDYTQSNNYSNSAQKSTKRSTISMSIHYMEKKNYVMNSGNSLVKGVSEFKQQEGNCLPLSPIRELDKHSMNINETLYHDDFHSPKLVSSPNPNEPQSPVKKYHSFAPKEHLDGEKHVPMEELKI